MVYRSNLRRKNNLNHHNKVSPEKTLPPPNLHLLKKPEDIPLPNEVEGNHTEGMRKEISDEQKITEKLNRYIYAKFPALKKIIKNIHTDDIILIGMIILLLDESSDDYYLIIILAYLLLTDLELFDF